MTEPFGVLVSSAGRRVGLIEIFRRCLANLDLAGPVVAADVSRYSAAVHLADEAVQVPPCTSPEFVPSILEVCRDLGVRLVIPTIDPELAVYAAERSRFAAAGVTVAISSPETVAICGDKQSTHRWLVENEFPTVRQLSLAEFTADGDGWEYPILVKPRRGSASAGVSVVADADQLAAATREGEFVVQSLARGDEFSIDVLVDRAGRCVSAVPRRRLEVRWGESSKGVTVRSELLESLARRLCEALPGARGPLTIQAFRDDEGGEVAVIELNARFGGGFPLSWEAGALHPQWMIEEILERPGTASSDAWRDGFVMLRYDQAVFIDQGSVVP